MSEVRYKIIKEWPATGYKKGDTIHKAMESYYKVEQWPEFFKPFNAITFDRLVERKSTLNAYIQKSGRKMGNSTRQINLAIDLLFEGYKVVVTDHWKNGRDLIANRDLLRRIVKRLEHEFLIERKHTRLNYDYLTIMLSDQYVCK